MFVQSLLSRPCCLFFPLAQVCFFKTRDFFLFCFLASEKFPFSCKMLFFLPLWLLLWGERKIVLFDPVCWFSCLRMRFCSLCPFAWVCLLNISPTSKKFILDVTNLRAQILICIECERVRESESVYLFACLCIYIMRRCRES